ncbi:hypothetical protein BKA61DRAFT_675995 [Leptodontidium sp. MPI-SDFR-AT-0119]|nr:hypothetical protein BKA61DRAFT_675995 [Leptodontidium sp. MPI-SDFR-AT-0119]
MSDFSVSFILLYTPPPASNAPPFMHKFYHAIVILKCILLLRMLQLYCFIRGRRAKRRRMVWDEEMGVPEEEEEEENEKLEKYESDGDFDVKTVFEIDDSGYLTV